MTNNEHPLRNILQGIHSKYLGVAILGHTVGLESRSERQILTTPIDKLLGKTALKSLPRLGGNDKFYNYSTAEYWHGTGRYQLRNGRVIDVAANIAASECIMPSRDNFDFKRDMDSISLARARVYARAYADMHGKGNEEDYRYGSAKFWACAFLGDIAVEATREIQAYKPAGYKQMMDHLKQGDVNKWISKVAPKRNGVMDLYERGSSIPDNYPVLINVKDEFIHSDTSKAVSIHEARAEEPIPLSMVNHIEVPMSRVIETEKIFKDTEVIPIEYGESHSSDYSFSEHLHGIV